MALGFKRIVSRFFIVVFIFAGLAGLVFVLTKDYFSPETRQLRKQMELVKEQEEAYKNDTFGGSTPEETLALFIDALKKGDTDLAAKYFVIDKQGEWLNYLNNVKKNTGLLSIIDEAKKLKLSNKNQEEAFFTIANDKKIVEVQVVIRKNQNGKWKITEL